MKNLFISFALLSLTMGKAQIWIRNTDKFADLKTKGVYVVMTDTTSDVNNAYWHIYKKYWTYSPVYFVSYEDMDKYIEPGNYFFTIIRNKINNERGILWVDAYSCSLELWEHKGKNKLNLKEEILNGRVHINHIGSKHLTDVESNHFTALAGAYLFSTEEKAFYAGDYKTSGEPDFPKLTFYTECNYAGIDKNGKSLYFNWNEGLLKNYLQGFMWYIEQRKYIDADSDTDIYEKDKMEQLKHDTLFIPEFAFTEYTLSKNNKDIPFLATKKSTKADIAKENQNIKNIFRKYKYPYKIISAQELSTKILHNPTPFSYLLYVVDDTFKQITIVNSATGENIYFTLDSRIKNTVFDNKGVIVSDVKNIKLLPEDIDKLANKMEAK